ncbi:hypothetical protein D3C72_973740 [compost metagenome]
MGRRHRAQAAFEHGAAVQGDTGRFGDGGGAQHGARAAVLGDLQGEHRGCAFAGQVEGIFHAFDGFVGHDRRRAHGVQAGHAGAVVARDRLFDQVDAVAAENSAGTYRDGFVPRLVDVDTHAGTVTQGFLDGDDVGQVAIDLAGSDLQLEDAVAAQVEHFFRFGDVFFRVTAGQGPGDGERITHAATEQFTDRQTKAFALGVEQRGFDTGFGEGVATDAALQAQHGGVDVAAVLADQQGGEVRVDVGLDAVRAFIAIGQATDGGGFADAFDAVGATHANDHQGLVLHGVHGQFVRADSRQIDDDRLDRLNGGCKHFDTRQVLEVLSRILIRLFPGGQYRIGLA